MSETLNIKREQCVGCEACTVVCPVHAIQMEADEEGFWYPHIHSELCVNCGACREHCPVSNEIVQTFQGCEPLAAYAAWTKNSEMRRLCSSGGIFGELAEMVLATGGYVVGAAYTKEHVVEHRIIHSLEDLAPLKGSKYLQSRIKGVYQEVKNLLSRNENVLFVGTPCQCSGLLAFLKRKPSNLLLCDFVCHGVNSPAVHQRYIREVEASLGKRVDAINHRDKADGWQNYQFSVSCAGEKYLLGGKRKNPFLRGFLTDLYLRPSCYQCPFKGGKRPTDLTLGDHWGSNEKTDERGISLILVQSKDGERVLMQIKDRIDLREIPFEQALNGNPSINHCANDRFGGRKSFFERWKLDGDLEKTIIHFLGKLD